MPMMRLVIRIGAAALLFAALLPRGVARHERVLFFAADGMRLDYAHKLIESGDMPVLGALLDHGLHGTLRGDHTGRGSLRWARVLSSGEDDDAVYVWQRIAALGQRSVAVAVPGTDYLTGDNLLVLAGADAAEGFVGDNIGSVVNAANAAVAGLDWPYAQVSAELGEISAELSAGQASGWIAVEQPAPDERKGVLRAYMLDDETAYLTPLYTRSRPVSEWIAEEDPALAGERYVPDEPTWAVSSSRVDEYLYDHIGDLTKTRALTAVELARGDWRLFVYVETLLDTLDRLLIEGRPEAVSAAGIPDMVRKAYVEVDRRIGLLAEAAGEDSLMVVVGLEPAPIESIGRSPARSDSSSVGFYAVAGDGRAETRRGSVEQVAPTLLYLAGVSLSGETIAPPLGGVVSRHWQRRLDRVSVAGGEVEALLPLNAKTLHSLGALTPKTPE